MQDERKKHTEPMRLKIPGTTPFPPAVKGVQRSNICILASIKDGSYKARTGSTKPACRRMERDMYIIVSSEYHKNHVHLQVCEDGIVWLIDQGCGFL
jgi:hypothetical protein